MKNVAIGYIYKALIPEFRIFMSQVIVLSVELGKAERIYHKNYLNCTSFDKI